MAVKMASPHSYVTVPQDQSVYIAGNTNDNSDCSTHDASKHTENFHLSAGTPSSTPPTKIFWKNSLILLLVPAGVTAFFLYIWLALLKQERDGAVMYGNMNQLGFFYAWFIIGVLALDWSSSGLTSEETAMLGTPLFAAPHLVGLMAHGERTWSGPSGWLRSLERFLSREDVAKGRSGLRGAIMTLVAMAVRPSKWAGMVRGCFALL
jgi:hypothetical protein